MVFVSTVFLFLYLIGRNSFRFGRNPLFLKRGGWVTQQGGEYPPREKGCSCPNYLIFHPVNTDQFFLLYWFGEYCIALDRASTLPVLRWRHCPCHAGVPTSIALASLPCTRRRRRLPCTGDLASVALGYL